jgi:energy-coupling factor transport system ATP-binding protein
MSLLSALGLWAAPPGGEAVVRDFSLEIGRGEWLALSGPNGGGKTTLALALAGLRPIQKGRVTLDRALSAGPRDQRGIAVILQDPSAQLFSSTVAEELGYTARNLGAEPGAVARDVARWAARLGLEEDLSSDPRTLSAGRQQLVLLAAALVSDPRLLIADEPGAHLDAGARARVLEAVRAEVARGLAVLWLTQDAREIEAADRLIWIGERPLRSPMSAAAKPAAVAPATLQGGDLARVRIRPRAEERGPSVRCEAAIEFGLPQTGVVALLGPNAAGKSVLLNALAGLEPAGQIEVDWRRAEGPPPILVSQYPERQLFQELVRDELAYAAVSRGIARPVALERATECLGRLDFGREMLDRRCWDLSSGERRLIEVVAGLIAPARLLALDEPSAGLDPRRREALASLIRERASSGPVALASQDRDWAAPLAASVLTLGQGAEKCLPSLSKKTD